MMRNILITGAGGGIGRACLDFFAANSWKVWASDLKAPKGILPDGAEFVPLDLSDETQIRDFAQHAAKNGPKFDALINNAAFQPLGPISEIASSEWDQTLAINLKAPYLLAQSLLSTMTKPSAIVNVVSVHALATSADIAAYAASKGGLLALTRSMAIEFASQGIRVNALLPGAVDTPMLQVGLQRSSAGPAKARQQLEERILLGRVGQPQEIARAAYFLADEEQSSYITGQSLVVDGGAMARLSTE